MQYVIFECMLTKQKSEPVVLFSFFLSYKIQFREKNGETICFVYGKLS